MPSIQFHIAGQAHEIELAMDLAPVAIGRLVAALPSRIDIHCAKIAGQHIFWHAPFLADIEKATDIMTLPPGTFLYWPERQFLELIYGELQAEKAAVSVLGRLKGEIGWLKELGRHVVERHGRRTTWAELVADPDTRGLAISDEPAVSAGHARLRAEREAVWKAEPDDIAVLLGRSGVMLPFGPTAMAEGEWRKLHEVLWRLRGHDYYHGTDRVAVARFLIQAFVDRIDGFCGMTGCGAVLIEASVLLEAEPGNFEAILDDLILYTGRVAAWLDLHIPWNDLNNEILRK